MRFKNVTTGLAALSLIIFIGCGQKETKDQLPSGNEPVPVRILTLKKSDVTSAVNGSGQFTTTDETYLSFKTGGIIQRIFVKEGDRVKAGQVLATLDLTEIQSQVKQAEAGLEKATRDFKRAEVLYRDSITSLERYQNAGTALDVARQQLSAARFNLQYSSIRAPHDGTVVRKIANEGQLSGPGTPVLLVSGKGRASWVLRIALSDREWAMVKPGNEAYIDVDALGLHRLPAIVDSKAEQADPMTGSFTVDLKLKNSNTIDLASGMFGSAVISSNRSEQLWEIPYEAVLDGHGETGFVFVTRDRKTAERIPVVIGEIGDSSIRIVSGLEGISDLIISGSAYLSDGSPIRIVK